MYTLSLAIYSLGVEVLDVLGANLFDLICDKLYDAVGIFTCEWDAIDLWGREERAAKEERKVSQLILW